MTVKLELMQRKRNSAENKCIKKNRDNTSKIKVSQRIET